MEVHFVRTLFPQYQCRQDLPTPQAMQGALRKFPGPLNKEGAVDEGGRPDAIVAYNREQRGEEVVQTGANPGGSYGECDKEQVPTGVCQT